MCTQPLLATQNLDLYKKQHFTVFRNIKQVPYSNSYHQKVKNRVNAFLYDDDKRLFFINKTETNFKIYKLVLKLPCRKCVSCILDWTRNWSIRSHFEMLSHPEGHHYFLTLTYDEDHVPVNSKTGSLTLYKRDVVLFMKRLRKKLGLNIKFIVSGEYGCRSTRRPHYHFILFNMPQLKDLIFVKYNFRKDKLYRSQTMWNLWQKGIVHVSIANYDCSRYVAGYMMKAKRSFIDKSKEFFLSSRNEAIGKKYFDSNWQEIYKQGKVRLVYNGKILYFGIPSYFVYLLKKKLTEKQWSDFSKRRQELAIKQYKKYLDNLDGSTVYHNLIGQNIYNSKVSSIFSYRSYDGL